MKNFETNLVGRDVRMPIDSLEERKKGVTEMHGEVVAVKQRDNGLHLHIAVYGQALIVQRRIDSVSLVGPEFCRVEE